MLAIADTVQTGVRLFFQGRFNCPAGTVRWLEFTGQPVAGTSGPSLRVIGTVQDISKRKQAEQQVARQAAELATLYATAPVGLFFYDTDLRYVRVNPTMAALNGLPAELHIGKTLRELLTPELADEVESQVRQVLDTGRPLLNCEVHGATTPRADEQQRHWLVSYHPVHAVDRTIMGVQGAVLEITERKQADEALRQSEQRFRALVTASSDLMCRMSPDWSEMRQVYDTNFAAEMEVPNGNWLESYIYRDDQPRLMALIHEAIRTKSLFEMEHRVRRADGSWGWMLSRAVPLLDARGEIVEWFGAGSDVTEQKRAEQALRESERFLRSSLDALSGHIAVLDESGTILETNAAWQRFGKENHAPEAGIGVGVNYLQHCEQIVSQDDQMPAYASGIKDVIAGRQMRFEMEYSCHSPTEQRWFVMRVTRFQGPGPVRIVIVHDNCTERKLGEQALRESQARYRTLFDSIDEGFCVIEMLFDAHETPIDLRYLEVNPAFEQQTGYWSSSRILKRSGLKLSAKSS
jgi:PAS domain S-box-containing protein